MPSRRRAPVPRYTARKLSASATAVTRAIAPASCARSPRGTRRLLATGGAQPVADVAHRLDRPLAVLPELAAQVADVHLQHLRARVELEAPDRIEDLLPREHLVRMAHEIGEQLELPGGQPHLLAAPLDPATAQVDAHAAG